MEANVNAISGIKNFITIRYEMFTVINDPVIYEFSK